MPLKFKLFFLTLLILFSCKKYPDDSHRTLTSPKKRLIEKTWEVVSYKYNGKELFNSYSYTDNPGTIICNKGDSISCSPARGRWNYSKYNFKKDGIAIVNSQTNWEVLDTNQTESDCSPVYIISETPDYEDMYLWQFDEHKKILKIRDNRGKENKYLIRQLDRNTLYLYLESDGNTEELLMRS